MVGVQVTTLEQDKTTVGCSSLKFTKTSRLTALAPTEQLPERLTLTSFKPADMPLFSVKVCCWLVGFRTYPGKVIWLKKTLSCVLFNSNCYYY